MYVSLKPSCTLMRFFFAKSYGVSDVQHDVTADLRVFSISERNALKKTEFVLSRH